jgi:hypothetical protein
LAREDADHALAAALTSATARAARLVSYTATQLRRSGDTVVERGVFDVPTGRLIPIPDTAFFADHGPAADDSESPAAQAQPPASAGAASAMDRGAGGGAGPPAPTTTFDLGLSEAERAARRRVEPVYVTKARRGHIEIEPEREQPVGEIAVPEQSSASGAVVYLEQSDSDIDDEDPDDDLDL